MRIACLLLVLFSVFRLATNAQSFASKIEYGKCPVKIDNKVIAICGQLVVPESRQKPRGNKVKLPFAFIRRPEAPAKTHVALFMTGGPGYSTIANIDSIGYGSDFLSFGGFVALDQRGTEKTTPCLNCPGVDEAIRQSYRQGLDKDSLVLAAVTACRKELAGKGIDLSAYNTIESAADINDLRLALKIDSLDLIGMSYSGGLMLTVARNHPEGVRSLILGSPLPGFVDYEEHALFSIDAALNRVFDYHDQDTGATQSYGNLRQRFRDYFTELNGKSFYTYYQEKNKPDSQRIRYTKDQLLEAIVNRLNSSQYKSVPQVIDEIINGQHRPYIKEILDNEFSGNSRLARGMRYSIYCSEQIAFANESLVLKQDSLLPWLAGYSFNNVNHRICDCWKVKPEPAIAKTQVYSAIPALLAAGDIDPWCPPIYNRIIQQTMPNAQVLIIKKRGHVPGYGADGINYLKSFIANPYQKLKAGSTGVIIE